MDNVEFFIESEQQTKFDCRAVFLFHHRVQIRRLPELFLPVPPASVRPAYIPGPLQILQRPFHRAFGDAEVCGNSPDGWIALLLLSGPVAEILVDHDGPCGQAGGVDGIEVHTITSYVRTFPWRFPLVRAGSASEGGLR